MPGFPLTWVVAADSARSRIFALKAANGTLEEIEDAANPAARQTDHDLAADRPGRSFDSKGVGRHAMESRKTVKENSVEKFAESLSASLADALQAGRFERLVLFAPPQFLGLLRAALSPRVAALVAHSADVEVTRESPAEIRARIPTVL